VSSGFQKKFTHRALFIRHGAAEEQTRAVLRVWKAYERRKKMNSRRRGCESCDTRWGQLCGIHWHTCPLRQSSACLGSQVQDVLSTECYISLERERVGVGRMMMVSRQSKEQENVECMIIETSLSPLSSVSHVSMTVPRMGSQSITSEGKAEYMYVCRGLHALRAFRVGSC
jgi:hypothetical protein